MLQNIKWPQVALLGIMVAALIAAEVLKVPVPHSIMSAVAIVIAYLMNPNAPPPALPPENPAP
jgi:hypothetical protein